MANKAARRLLWIDMEMTGLNVERERIIEVAAVVTDYDFNSLEEYHAIIRQPMEFLDRMDEWNKKHHGESGLTSKVPHGTPQDQVERNLAQLVKKHFQEPAVLAGNSIGQDRLFINKYMPQFAATLHYRMLDVTAWKIIFKEKYEILYDKQDSHRAVDDIRESIGELKFYMSHLQLPLK